MGEETLLGKSSSHSRVLRLIERVKNFDTPVSIAGESGTGKELVAKTIHRESRRSRRPFVAVNCCAIPEHLLESELFGYVRGAFTGAYRDRTGMIEEAHGGTFFLDEIGDLPLHLQAKLLRLLQEKEIRRVGDSRSRKVDARFISATHRDLEKEVASGRFRKDLYFRLKIITIHIPPLRERREDIPVLLDFFVDKYSRELDLGGIPSLSPQAVNRLLSYDWPGNIRELQNEIQRCLVLHGNENPISPDCLSDRIRLSGNPDRRDGLYGFFEARADFEKKYIREALWSCGFHREKTAAKIGLSRQGLYKLIKKHGISMDRGRGLLSGFETDFANVENTPDVPTPVDHREVFC